MKIMCLDKEEVDHGFDGSIKGRFSKLLYTNQTGRVEIFTKRFSGVFGPWLNGQWHKEYEKREHENNFIFGDVFITRPPE